MAPTLRCPDCGHRHPLAAYASREAFRCERCGRALKVPERYRRPEQPPASPPRPEPEHVGGGRVTVTPLPAQGPGAALLPPISPRQTAVDAELTPLRVGWRIAIWIVAVPLGAVVGAYVASALGMLTMSQLEDVFLETGARRFGALIRFVPAWGLATALLVHGTVTAVERVRRRLARRAGSARASTPSPPAARAGAPAAKGVPSSETLPSDAGGDGQDGPGPQAPPSRAGEDRSAPTAPLGSLPLDDDQPPSRTRAS